MLNAGCPLAVYHRLTSATNPTARSITLKPQSDDGEAARLAELVAAAMPSAYATARSSASFAGLDDDELRAVVETLLTMRAETSELGPILFRREIVKEIRYDSLVGRPDRDGHMVTKDDLSPLVGFIRNTYGAAYFSSLTGTDRPADWLMELIGSEGLVGKFGGGSFKAYLRQIVIWEMRRLGQEARRLPVQPLLPAKEDGSVPAETTPKIEHYAQSARDAEEAMRLFIATGDQLFDVWVPEQIDALDDDEASLARVWSVFRVMIESGDERANAGGRTLKRRMEELGDPLLYRGKPAGHDRYRSCVTTIRTAIANAKTVQVVCVQEGINDVLDEHIVAVFSSRPHVDLRRSLTRCWTELIRETHRAIPDRDAIFTCAGTDPQTVDLDAIYDDTIGACADFIGRGWGVEL